MLRARETASALPVARVVLQTAGKKPQKYGGLRVLHEVDQRRVLRVEDGKEAAGEEYDQQITAHADGEEHAGGKAAREAGWACPDCWRHFEKERIQQRQVLPKA